jgi:hypothetical protein
MMVNHLLLKINSILQWYYGRQWAFICFFFLIVPQECLIPIFGLHVSILHDLAHLSIQECVSDYHFFLLEILLESFSLE